MRIGIIGAGHIGGTPARLFVDAGHEVALSNSRGPETLAGLVEQLGQRAKAVTAAEAARSGDVVVVSVPFGRYRELPTEGVSGKVVIDTTNYYSQRDGHFEELDRDRTTSSELLQAHLSGARVVKAFNAILRTRLRDDGRPSATTSASAYRSRAMTSRQSEPVEDLIDQIGFDPVDGGTLSQGRRNHQPGAPASTEGLRTAELRARLTA